MAKNASLSPQDEHDEILLSRMLDTDGTVWELVFKGPTDARQKCIPRDQAEDLVERGLADFLVDIDGNNWGITISRLGRVRLSELRPTPNKYSELGEDDLINLAAHLAEVFTTGHGQVANREAAMEMVSVVQALKARRDATEPARNRVGEYLRQQAILEAQYQDDLKRCEEAEAAGRRSYTTPKQPTQVLDEIRSDEYAGTASIRLTDLQRLVPTATTDTKTRFYETQDVRLQVWQEEGLSEKQAALLPCIAKGHIKSYTSGSYSGENKGWNHEDNCPTCSGRIDGRSIQALLRKGIAAKRLGLGVHSGSTLMLKPKPVDPK